MTITEQELIARAEIQEVLTYYAQAQDQDQWDLYERVFTPDALLEFPGTGLGNLSAAEFRAFIETKFNPTRLSGQHALANTTFAIDGGSARTITEVLSFTLQYTDREGVLTRMRGNSLYVDDWVFSNGEWRIRHRVTAQKNIETDEVTYTPELIASIRAGSSTRWVFPEPEAQR
jgi:hypothetical protein